MAGPACLSAKQTLPAGVHRNLWLSDPDLSAAGTSCSVSEAFKNAIV
jgi:hypothetical protein